MAQWGPDPSFIPLSVASKHSVPKSTCPKSKTAKSSWQGLTDMHQASLPRNLSRRSGWFFDQVLAGSSSFPHPTISSRQPGLHQGGGRG